MRLFATLIIATSLSFSATSAPAAPPERLALDTPKDSVKTFITALEKGDVETAKRCTIDQPGHREAAAAVAQLSAAALKLEETSKKKFKTTFESTGNPKVTLNVPDANAANYATVTGDDQHAVVTLPGTKHDPLRLTKVNGEWLLDMTDEQHRTADDLKTLAGQGERVAKSITELTKEIEADKYANVTDARNAFMAALFKTVEPQVSVTVKSAESKK
jgi:hypothetical protein